MKKLLIFFLALSVIAPALFAQQAKIDSLQNLLNRTKDNSQKIMLLNDIARLCFFSATLDTVKAKSAIEKMQQLSDAENNIRGKVSVMLRQSSLLRSRKNNDAAISLLDECRAISEKNNLHNELAEAMVMKAVILQVKKKNDDAIKLFHEALPVAKAIEDPMQIMWAYRGLGFSYYLLGGFDSSIAYYRLLREISNSKNEVTFYAQSTSMLGIMYSMRGDYSQAIEVNKIAVSQYQILGLQDQVANVLNNLANSYRYLGNLEEALQYYYKAIALREELRDSSQLASSIFNAADILKVTGQKKKADEYYRRSLAISILEGDKNMEAICYGGIADMYRDDGQLDSALSYHKKALALFEETEDKGAIPQSMVSVGQIYMEQKNYDEAISYFTKAKPMLEAAGLKQNLAILNNNMGRLYEQQDKLNEAAAYYQKGYDIASEIDYMEAKRQYSWHLAQIYRQLGNFSKALEYSEISSAANDTLLNRDRVKSMQELTVKYETEKKEQQISLLEKQRTIAQMDISLKQEKINKQELMDKEKTHQLTLISKDNEIKSLQVTRQGLEIEKQKGENQKKKVEVALLQKDNEVKTANELRAKQMRNFYIAGIILLFLLGALAYYRYRERKALSEKLSASLTQLKETQQQLIETERLREQENIRLQVSRDLHDDIGSTLSSIHMLSSTAKKRLEEKDEKKLVESLEKIGEHTQSTLENMNDIIWSIKPGNDSLSEVLARMREYAGTVLEATGINYSIDFPDDIQQMNLPLSLKNNMFLIFKEAVNNLAKYSRCTQAAMAIKIKDNRLQMTIDDNGAGFDISRAVEQGGNGLNNMKRRAEESVAALDIVSTEGKGTTIRFAATILPDSPLNMGEEKGNVSRFFVPSDSQ